MTAAENSLVEREQDRRYSLRVFNARSKQGMHGRGSSSRALRCLEDYSADSQLNRRNNPSLPQPELVDYARKEEDVMTSKEPQSSVHENFAANHFMNDVADVGGSDQDLDDQDEDEMNRHDTTPTYPCPECDGGVFVFSSEMTTTPPSHSGHGYVGVVSCLFISSSS
jgi:hypothetical protein